MTHRIVLGLALVAACGPSDVSVRGRVYNGIGEKSRPLVDADVIIRNGLGGFEGSAVTNRNGRFSISVGGGQRIYAVVEGEGFRPTSFTGSSGSDTVLRVPDQTLFAVSFFEIESRLTRFEGCPGLDLEEGVPVVFGEVRVNNLTDEVTGENPLVQTAQVEWIEAAGDETVVEACYLDETGSFYDPDAERTGPSGLYVIPNVPVGLGFLAVRYELIVGAEQTSVTYDAYMPETGVVARFPTWVEFETPIE